VQTELHNIFVGCILLIIAVCGLHIKAVWPMQTVTAVIFLLCVVLYSRLTIRNTRASSGMLLLSWTLW